jgi:hypothetical protein
MNKSILGFIITLMAILIIVLSLKYIKLLNDYDWQHDNINSSFKSTLSFAASGFAADYDNSIDEDKKIYNYNEAMSNLGSSSLLFRFTTYSVHNNDLGLALSDLYKLMEQNIYKKTIINKSKLIYKNLIKLAQNPEDTQSADNISKLEEEIKNSK